MSIASIFGFPVSFTCNKCGKETTSTVTDDKEWFLGWAINIKKDYALCPDCILKCSECKQANFSSLSLEFKLTPMLTPM